MPLPGRHLTFGEHCRYIYVPFALDDPCGCTDNLMDLKNVLYILARDTDTEGSDIEDLLENVDKNFPDGNKKRKKSLKVRKEKMALLCLCLSVCLSVVQHLIHHLMSGV